MNKTNEYKLAQHFLIRTALFPYEGLEELRLNQTIKIYELLIEKQKQATECRERICEWLFKILPLIKDDKERLKVIALKRSVFNGRQVDQESFKIISSYTRSDERIILADWIELERELKNLELDCQNTFNSELVSKRRILQKHIGNTEFQKGIQLTGDAIFKALDDYLAYSINQEKPTKSIRNSELSLLNYLNRMIMKTSPFGAFTGLSIGKFTEETSETKITFDANKTKSFISYNRALVTYLERAIVKIKGVREYSFITLNNTVNIGDSYVSYFKRGEDGTPKAYGGEAFMRLPSNEILISIINNIRHSKEAQTLDEVCNNILSFDGDILRVEAASYIDKLIEIQILELSFNIPDQEEDFLGALIIKLSNINTKIAKRFLFYIIKLKILQNKFESYKVALRSKCLIKINQTINKLMEILEKTTELNILNSKVPLYEDVKLSYDDININNSDHNVTLASFEYINKLSPLFDDSLLHRLIFTRLFTQKYKVGGRCDNLLEFYEYYSKEQHKIKNESASGYLTEKDLITLEQINKIQSALFKTLANRTSSEQPFILTNSLINGLISNYPPTVSYNDSSSYYCQLLSQSKSHNKEAPDLVLDKIGTGYGKYFSRFCFMFDEGNFSSADLIKSIRKNLNDKDKIYADLLAVLGINVNIHPALFDYELVYPGCKSMLEQKQQIYLNDVAVIHDQVGDKIILWSKKHNKEIVLIPLGFLFPRLAPPLYNFLCYFSQASWINFSIWDRYDNWLIDKKEKIRFYPRVITGNVILERATWKISKDVLISRNNDESDYKYFIRVQEWIKHFGIPNECFLRLASPVLALRKESIGDEGAIEKYKLLLQNKQRKPQYIDFNNILHINIFDKLISKAKGEITIQEVLPSVKNMFCASNGQHHATEFLFEMYKN